MMAESGLNGEIDLTKVYGNKILNFKFEIKEIEPIFLALQQIYNHPENYVLFEMCMDEERDETLNDIKEILIRLDKVLA